MDRYVNLQTGKEVLELSRGFNDIDNLLRETDRRPIRNLFNFLLLTEGAPSLYLGGSVINPETPREYGDIDLLAVYSNKRSSELKSRLITTQKFLDESSKVVTPRGFVVPSIQLGKSQYLVTYNGEARKYLDTRVDETFVLEPINLPPAMGVVAVGSPIELCLTSLENFERDYRKVEKK